MILDIDVSRRKKNFRDVWNCSSVSDCREVYKFSSISRQSLQRDIWFCVYSTSFPLCVSGKCPSLHLWRYSYRLPRKTYDMMYVKRLARKSWFHRQKNYKRSDDRWSSIDSQSDTRDTWIPRKGSIRQLHTRSYFTDVHGWDLVSISQQNY